MQSTIKKLQAASKKNDTHLSGQSIDEKFGKYFANLGCSERNNRTVSENVTLADIPLDVRRREAKKPLYLVRYE